jgi:hypothetical protein
MKNHQYIPLAVVIFSSLCLKPSACAQGSLTPPGAPAPTMKTADQIYAKLDPRTIVNSVNTPGDSQNLFIISNSGSYFLATNLIGVSGKNGINIAANNVTLDLNGFAVQGGTGSLNGVYIYSQNNTTNVTVRNGTVNGWGGSGVFAAYGELTANPNYQDTQDLVFEHLNLSGNGWQNSDDGIAAANCVIRDCQSQYNRGNGISVWFGTVTGCLAQNNVFSGIVARGANNRIIGNSCISNNLIQGVFGGITYACTGSRIEDNHCAGNRLIGIGATIGGSFATNNFIIKNTVVGAGDNQNINNYVLLAGNVFGPILNDSTGAITNSSPWGNFSF